MKRGTWLVPLACVLIGCRVPSKLPPGIEAPPFKGKAQDGEHYSLLDLTRRGPVLVAFLDSRGAASLEGLEYLRLFDRAYKGRAATIAIVNLGETEAKEWAKARGLRFPAIPDPDLAICGRYGVTVAPYAIVVGRDGGIIRRWADLSRASLDEINASLAKSTQGAPASIETKHAAEKPSKGDLLSPGRPG